MRKIKIAQIGTSTYSHGYDIFRAIKALDDVFEIVGYALPENEREKFPNRMPIFDGLREMTVDEILNDPEIEAVTVETEEIYLTKYALKAVKAKKHIHMEKPGGLSLSEFEEMISIAKANGTVFHTGYMYRYNPIISNLIERIDRGELGDIISVEAQMCGYHSVNQRSWMNTFKEGGMLFFLGCHLIDLVYRIQGAPDKVTPLTCSTGKDGIHVQDYGMALLHYPHGVSFVKATDIERGGFAKRRLVVTGTKETADICPLEMHTVGGQYTDITNYTSEKWADMGVKTRSEVYDRYEKMMRSFGEFVRGERQNPYTYDYELELYKLVLECCGMDEK